jgi:predicted small metal-binding protein
MMLPSPETDTRANARGEAGRRLNNTFPIIINGGAMYKVILTALVAVMFLLTFSSPAAAQGYPDAKKKEADKTMSTKGLKTAACDPMCGFSVTSHDDAEVMAMMKDHAKKHHKKDMTDAQVKEMMKPAAKMGEMKSEAPPH